MLSMNSIRLYVSLVIVIAAGLHTISCAPGVSRSRPSPAVSDNQITATPLGPGDIFEVRVYDEKELTGVHRIAPDGTVDIPLAGRLHVADLSRSEVVDLLGKKFQQFINQPQVSVFIKERKSKKIFVFGKVKKPGTFPFEGNMNIIQAITLAGGFDKLADQNGTYVNRVVQGKEQRLQVAVKAIGQGKSTNFSLKPGDIIYIPESIF